VSTSDASLPAAFVVPAVHVTHTLETTCSFIAQSTGERPMGGVGNDLVRRRNQTQPTKPGDANVHVCIYTRNPTRRIMTRI
jgi:hypothetical protein